MFKTLSLVSFYISKRKKLISARKKFLIQINKHTQPTHVVYTNITVFNNLLKYV